MRIVQVQSPLFYMPDNPDNLDLTSMVQVDKFPDGVPVSEVSASEDIVNDDDVRANARCPAR